MRGPLSARLSALRAGVWDVGRSAATSDMGRGAAGASCDARRWRAWDALPGYAG